VYTVQDGSPQLEFALTTAVDSADNIYIGGFGFASIDDQPHAGEEDIFLIKYAADGSKVFTHMAGTTGYDAGIDLTVDTDDNIYLIGNTDGNLNGQLNANPGSTDCFLMKFNSSGSLQFTVLSGSAADESAFAVAVDNRDGSIYVVGHTAGNFYDASSGGEDIFLLKYFSNGTMQYSFLTGSSGDDMAYHLDIDSLGSIYITGATDGDLHDQVNAGGLDIFLIKYSQNGTRVYTILQGTAEDDEGYSVSIDVYDDVYLAGYSYGDLNGLANAGSADIFLMKYEPDGLQVFTQLYGTEAYEDGYSIVVDPNGLGNIYLTGGTFGNLLGNSNNGQFDIFMLRVDSTGVAVFCELSGTMEWDYGYGIAMDTVGNVYVTGYTGGSIDNQQYLGGYDLYFIKYLRD
ncbi:unnamed protein product, partial [Ectocarpus fasciculatus]